jgi:hypothetical protein
MRPTWLIEANVHGLSTEELQHEVRRHPGRVRDDRHGPPLPTPVALVRDLVGVVPQPGEVVIQGPLEQPHRVSWKVSWGPLTVSRECPP